MTWDKVDLANRTFVVRQKKTGAWLKIAMGDELAAVFQWFHDVEWNEKDYVDIPPCPYVIHRKPRIRTKRLMDAVKRGDQHRYQVQPNDLTKVFRQARDKGGYYDHIENPKERPAFHDLRALGIFALAKAGYSVEYIQPLAGHADKAMTEHYMLGHEQIRPVAVEAGLSLDNVDWDTVDWDEPLAPVLQAIIEEETEE